RNPPVRHGKPDGGFRLHMTHRSNEIDSELAFAQSRGRLLHVLDRFHMGRAHARPQASPLGGTRPMTSSATSARRDRRPVWVLAVIVLMTFFALGGASTALAAG